MNSGTAKRQVDGGVSDTQFYDAQFYDAIVSHFGVLAHVALAMGISRAALNRRIGRSAELQAAVNGARSVLVTNARRHLEQSLRAGASWAQMFRAGVSQRPVAFAGCHEGRALPASTVAREACAAVADSAAADAARLRLVLALHAGEPRAVMYCLSHLDMAETYARHRRNFPESMFVEIPPEVPLDQVTAPTVDEAATTEEVTATDGVAQQHAEAAPTLGVGSHACVSQIGRAHV